MESPIPSPWASAPADRVRRRVFLAPLSAGQLYNRRLRNECLNVEVFFTFADLNQTTQAESSTLTWYARGVCYAYKPYTIRGLIPRKH
jgi:hypothetical protein